MNKTIEKMPLTDNNTYSEEKELRLNRTIIDAGLLGATGLVFGIGASIFFKNKRFIRNFGLGLGIGFALSFNVKNRNFKS